jgi:ribulose-5-phosphate 4-epimerase/fuculose-1-phosphate aldolase
MSNVAQLTPDSGASRSQVSAEEWQARVDLAACYRLIAHFGMTDIVDTHISARVPGPDHHFLINPYGWLFHEITASSLVKIDLDGAKVDGDGEEINYAGYVIHSAIHAEREDAGCVLHTHTTAGMAVSAQAEGLLPLTQHALRFYGNLAYHDYEGIALDTDERKRLVADLGMSRAMILRNHGLLTVGRNAPEAFHLMFMLEKSCQSQIQAMSGGAKLVFPNENVRRHTAGQYADATKERPAGSRSWPGLLRLLDKLDDSYKH